MVFAGDLKHSRERLHVFVNKRTDLVGNVLVNQHDSYVIPIFGKLEKCILNVRRGSFVVDDKKVLLSLFVDVTNPSENKAGRRVLPNV